MTTARGTTYEQILLEHPRYGIVSRAVPPDDLLNEALALADEIAQKPTGALITRQYQSAGHEEAIRAFIEKRDSVFNQ